MISTVPIQCNMAEIFSNRIPYNLENKPTDIILITFLSSKFRNK